MQFNYHTHTPRCNHASGTEREYIENAIKCGWTQLGFSDHAPMIFPEGVNYYSCFRMAPFLAEDYVKTVNALKEEYKSQIKIFLGYEFEYYPKTFEKTLAFMENLGYDYLILGEHFTYNEYDQGAMYSGSVPGTCDFGQLANYVDQVIEGLSTGKFLYVAHPDLFNFVGDKTFYKMQIDRLCEYCVKNNVPLELNLLGVASGRHYPNEKFWEIAGKWNVPVIFGVDAHDPNAILTAETNIQKLQPMIMRCRLNVIKNPLM